MVRIRGFPGEGKDANKTVRYDITALTEEEAMALYAQIGGHPRLLKLKHELLAALPNIISRE